MSVGSKFGNQYSSLLECSDNFAEKHLVSSSEIQRQRRLIIHAGMHKTGSTAIQHCLAGENIPEVHTFRLGQPNHSVPLTAMFGENPETNFQFRKRGLTATDVAAKRDKLNKSVHRQIQNKSAPHFLLSAEWFSRGRIPELQRFFDQFSKSFEKIDVYIYIRDPQGFVTSSFQQGIKTGAKSLFVPWPNYRKRVEALDGVFGRENVHTRIYNSTTFSGSDVVQDFFSWVGLPPPTSHYTRKNSSMSAAAVALTACYWRNSVGATGSPEKMRRHKQIMAVFKNLPSPPLRLGMKLVSKLVEQNHKDLEWIEQRMGLSFPAERTQGDDGVFEISSNDELIHSAAFFCPLLRESPPSIQTEDVVEADKLAWGSISSFISNLPAPSQANT